MNIFLKPEQIDIVMLCGGKGKRLQPVLNDRPKPMAEINGRPFLDILIDYITNYGFQRFILCTGYMGNFIKEYYQKKKGEIEILFSEEKEPLGTGGCIKNAELLIKGNTFLVLNGDSFILLDLNKFVIFHTEKKAIVSMAVSMSDKNDDYGRVKLGNDNRIISFNEKVADTNLINAGVYLFEKDVLSLIPANTNYSLEYDLFPSIGNLQGNVWISDEWNLDRHRNS